MEQPSILLAGSACADAATALTASPLLAGCAIRQTRHADGALPILDEASAVAATVILWESDATAELPVLIAKLVEHPRNPLMAIVVRSTVELPVAIVDRLWDLGVADRQFGQRIDGHAFAESMAVVVRDYGRQRMHRAIAESAVRLEKTKSFAELAALALRILREQGIGRRGAMFCFQRNTAGPQLLAIAGTGVYGLASCTPIGEIGDTRTREFAQRAWDRRESQFEGDLAALHVGTAARTYPALILLALDAPLLPAQKSMLESFARAIAPAVEENQLAQQLVRTQRAMISTLATLAEYKDNHTGEHVARVARITAEIASYLGQTSPGDGIDADVLEYIGHASILHDIGKVAIPERVLLKPGALDAEERAIINSHVVIGHEILKKAAGLAAHGDARLFHLASEIALNHHERYDGRGYPHGLEGEAIPLSARIVAVVDVFDALISHRPYKAAWSVERALGLLREESGRHFDPRVVDAFVAVLERKATANFIQWSDAMSVGHPELDRDHQRLIGILNHLGVNVELGNRNIVEFILDDLADYARVHFEREELHLERVNFPELERHRGIHEKISQRIEDAKWEYFQGFADTLDNELLHFLTGWLNHHILVEDMKYNPSAAQA